MKVIAIGTRGFPFIQGGIETHCHGLYPELVKLGCEVTVVRRRPYINCLNQEKEYAGVKFKDLWAPKNKSVEAIVHTFLAVLYCRMKSPDLVHFHGVGPSVLVPFARLLGMKTIVTSQGPDYDRQKWGRFAKFIIRLGERWSAKYSNELIVVSEVINNIVKEKYNRHDAHVIYNGVEAPQKIESTNYIESLGLEKNKYIIGVARFVKEKGFDYLIDAYRQLKKTEYKLVLAGDADHETAYSVHLKKKARENGVVMTGFIKGRRLSEIFSHARLFVLPSFHEGLSLALLEALSYNLDVLVSDIPANRTAPITADCFFHVGDTDDLTRRLSDKLNAGVVPRYDLSEYQWNEIASKTYRVYEKLVPKHKKKSGMVSYQFDKIHS